MRLFQICFNSNLKVNRCRINLTFDSAVMPNTTSILLWRSETKNWKKVKKDMAGHSGRAVSGMKCLRSLEHWDVGFESR
jgi:hypothetical protein